MIVPQTLDQYRQDLVTAVEAAKAGFNTYPLVIEYDNRIIVDTQRQTNPYLSVEIQFSAAQQGDLSANPFHRFTGLLILTAKVKEGDGSAKALALLEHFYPKLQRRRIGQVNVEMASIPKPVKIAGWWGQSAILPLWFSKVY